MAPSQPGAATVYRYVLRVEGGTNVDAAAAAAVIENVLNDDRGWRGTEGVSYFFSNAAPSETGRPRLKMSWKISFRWYALAVFRLHFFRLNSSSRVLCSDVSFSGDFSQR